VFKNNMLALVDKSKLLAANPQNKTSSDAVNMVQAV
jgi:hypothetical protein